jgi:hypothetical protein
MLTAVWIITGLAVLCIFFVDAELVGTDSSQSQNRSRLDLLHYARNIIFGLAAWLWLTVLSTYGLRTALFQDQSNYIFSGSPITVIPAIFWGLIIAWLASGKRVISEGDGGLSTTEQRFDKLFDWLARAVSFLGYSALWIVAAVILFVLVSWFGNLIDERISSMAPSKAIILGALIIAIAIYLGVKGSK